jgi:hypothetical protein
VYRVLVGKPEGKRPLGGPRRRWGIILDGSSGSGMWGFGIDLAGKIVNAVMNLRDSIKCG